MTNSGHDIPLFVDLDGTLLKTDTLFEAVLILLKTNIFHCLSLLLWLTKGRAYLKYELSKRVNIPVASLPINTAFLEYLRTQKEEQRELILISASNQKAVDEVNDHIKLFDAAFGSDEKLYELNGKKFSGAIQGNLTVKNRRDTDILELSFKSPFPSESKLIVNTVNSTTFLEVMQQIYIC